MSEYTGPRTKKKQKVYSETMIRKCHWCSIEQVLPTSKERYYYCGCNKVKGAPEGAIHRTKVERKVA